MFFHWLYPEHFRKIADAVKICPHDIDLNKSVLKLFYEISSNSAHRLKFENMDGFMVCKLICPVLAEILRNVEIRNQSISSSDKEQKQKTEHRIKFFKIGFKILTNCLSGNYVLFDIFNVYHDTCFLELTKIIFMFIREVKNNEIQQFPKAEKVMYNFMQDFFNIQAEFGIKTLDTEDFIRIFELMFIGITHANQQIAITSFQIIDEIVDFFARDLSKYKSKYRSKIHEILLKTEPILIKITYELVRILAFEDFDYLYSIIAPVYSLTMLSKGLLEQAQKMILMKEEDENLKEKLNTGFKILLNGVEFNTDSTNRDKFLGNYIKCKTSIKDYI